MASLYHTEKWWKSKYKQLMGWAERNKISTNLTNKSEEAGIREVKSQWMQEYNKGTKDIYAAIKYSWQYESPYKTAIAFHKSLQKRDIKINLKDLKKMTTSELYDAYGDYIIQDYNEELEKSAIKKYLAIHNVAAQSEELKTLTPDEFYKIYGFRPDLGSEEFKKILNSVDVKNEAQEFIDENWWGS